MTLEEAVAACPIIPCNYESETLTMLPVNVARTLKAHAERTVEARSDEPEAVKRLREAPVWHLVTDYIDTITAERDRLAACVERVKKLPTWDHDPTGDTKKYATMGKMDEAGYTLTEQYAGEWVLRADILAALEDA